MQKAMGRAKITLVLVALLAAPPQPVCSSAAEGPKPEGQGALTALLGALSTERMLASVARLSGSGMEGRQTGTQGDLASAIYVLGEFDSASSGADPDPLRARAANAELVRAAVTVPLIRDGATVELTAGGRTRRLSVGSGFLPVLDSPSVDVLATVAFVGYGIADPARGFDEYEGLKVRDRVVLFLRGAPPGYATRVSHADKVRWARDRGAVAYLTASGPIRSPYELRRGIPAGPLAYYGSPDPGSEQVLPGAWISTDAASWLVGILDSLEALQGTINEDLVPRSRTLPALAHLSWEADRVNGTLHNVVFRLPLPDHGARADAVVVGAHRDHFGRQAGLVFPGADDNASGTAVLLEVARVLRGADPAPLRSLLFVSFSGEEQGLRGSRLYVGRPSQPLDRTAVMINIDHVGVGDGRLIVGVAGLPKEVAEEAARLAGLAGRIDIYGYFPGGDHVPFREAGVPTITVVSGGPHPHFHQPTDVPGTVQPAILTNVARYVLTLIWLLAYTA